MAVAITSVACLATAAVLLVRLHAVPTGLDPVRDAVSDYGTTRFHTLYRAMVVALGAGALLLAIALTRETDARDVYWLWVYAAARIAIAFFMTDRDPPPFSAEGRIHWVLAAVAFTAIAFAASDIDWSGDPAVLRPIGYAVAASAIATLLTRAVPSWRAIFGLVERLLYVTSIAWLVIAAVAVATGS